MSFNCVRSVGAACLALVLAACAQEPPKPASIEETKEVVATVEAVNVETRMLALRSADGKQFAVHAPEARNLPQVKVGDRVVTRYYESLAVELRQRGDKSGSTQAPVVETAASQAPAGARPGAAIGAQDQPDGAHHCDRQEEPRRHVLRL